MPGDISMISGNSRGGFLQKIIFLRFTHLFLILQMLRLAIRQSLIFYFFGQLSGVL